MIAGVMVEGAGVMVEGTGVMSVIVGLMTCCLTGWVTFGGVFCLKPNSSMIIACDDNFEVAETEVHTIQGYSWPKLSAG